MEREGRRKIGWSPTVSCMGLGSEASEDCVEQKYLRKLLSSRCPQERWMKEGCSVITNFLCPNVYPAAAITSHHKLGRLKREKFILTVLEVRSPTNISWG